MRIEKILADIEKAQEDIMFQTFNNPPPDWVAFKTNHAFWRGLNECHRIIKAAIKDAEDEV